MTDLGLNVNIQSGSSLIEKRRKKVRFMESSNPQEKEKLFKIKIGLKKNVWTSTEDNLLNKLVMKLGAKKWKNIAKYFDNKTAVQCSARYRRIKKGIKKDPWTVQEDKKLKELVKIYGKNWSLLAKCLGNRSGKQIRERYINNLDPRIIRRDFNEAEDNLIFILQKKLGNKWTNIKSYFYRRSADMIKNRFYSFVKYKITESNYKKTIFNDMIRTNEEIMQFEREKYSNACEIDNENIHQIKILINSINEKIKNLENEILENNGNDSFFETNNKNSDRQIAVAGVTESETPVTQFSYINNFGEKNYMTDINSFNNTIKSPSSNKILDKENPLLDSESRQGISKIIKLNEIINTIKDLRTSNLAKNFEFNCRKITNSFTQSQPLLNSIPNEKEKLNLSDSNALFNKCSQEENVERKLNVNIINDDNFQMSADVGEKKENEPKRLLKKKLKRIKKNIKGKCLSLENKWVSEAKNEHLSDKNIKKTISFENKNISTISSNENLIYKRKNSEKLTSKSTNNDLIVTNNRNDFINCKLSKYKCNESTEAKAFINKDDKNYSNLSFFDLNLFNENKQTQFQNDRDEFSQLLTINFVEEILRENSTKIHGCLEIIQNFFASVQRDSAAKNCFDFFHQRYREILITLLNLP